MPAWSRVLTPSVLFAYQHYSIWSRSSMPAAADSLFIQMCRTLVMCMMITLGSLVLAARNPAPACAPTLLMIATSPQPAKRNGAIIEFSFLFFYFRQEYHKLISGHLLATCMHPSMRGEFGLVVVTAHFVSHQDSGRRKSMANSQYLTHLPSVSQ